jgi:hypothetical protein
MKSLSKEHIDSAFESSLMNLSQLNQISAVRMTLAIRFLEKGKTLIQLCRQGGVKMELSFHDLLNNKLLGLRFSATEIEKLFKTVHNAFMIQTQLENPARISLVLYLSKKAGCPSLAIMQDEKAIKVVTLFQVIEATELESEQLN